MKINEHYSRARHTSNLKSEPRSTLSAADVLTAAGMTAQKDANALLLWSVVYGGKSSQKHALVEGLTQRLTAHMLTNRLKGEPRNIARAVIAYHLHAVCQPCSGVGYQVIPGTITRSDDFCPECAGAGKPPPPEDAAFAWLHQYVSGLIGKAAGKMMDKLAGDMDL